MSSKRNSNDAQVTYLQSSATCNSKSSYGQKLTNNQTNGPIERSDNQTRNSLDNRYSDNRQNNKYHADNKVTSSQGHDRSSATAMGIYEDMQKRRDVEKEDAEDCLEDSGDIITDFFGAIIDPSNRPNYLRQHSSVRQPPPRPPLREISNVPRGPDRSNLKLEGLRKYRPKSFDKTPERDVPDICYSRQSSRTRRDRTVVEVHRGRFQVHDLSPEVEVDGPDYAGMY